MSDRVESVEKEQRGQRRQRRRAKRGRFACLVMITLGLLGASSTLIANSYPDFDLLSHFIEHFAVIIVAFFIGWLMPVVRVLTGIALSLAGFAVLSLWPVYDSVKARAPIAAVAGEVPIKLMTFNTWTHNEDWRLVEREIRKQAPDIALLIEFGPGKKPLLRSVADQYPFVAECADTDFCHMAILSKFRITESDFMTGWQGPPYIRVRFGAELDDLTIVGIHSARPPPVKAQLKQFQELGRFMRRFGEPRVVMGDFNSTPYSRVHREFVTRTNMDLLSGPRTWPAKFGGAPQFAIDHVYASRQLRLLSPAYLGDASGSDHYPVIVETALKKR